MTMVATISGKLHAQSTRQLVAWLAAVSEFIPTRSRSSALNAGGRGYCKVSLG